MKATQLAVLSTLTVLWGCSTHFSSARSTREYLPGVKEYLQGFVDAEAVKTENYFYISPAKKGEAGTIVYAYWLTENSVIAIDVPTERQNEITYSSDAYRNTLDLSECVVPTAQDNATQNYWVEDSESVKHLLRACMDSGVKFIIEKKQANQALEPTRTGGTSAAEPAAAPPARVAHL